MSRVHDALRRADQLADEPVVPNQSSASEQGTLHNGSDGRVSLAISDLAAQPPGGDGGGLTLQASRHLDIDWQNFLARCAAIPFKPAPETHLIDAERPHEVPAEEFRSLRTRLN